MKDDSIRSKLADYVQNTYLVEFGTDGIDQSTDLFEAGIFDSMAMVNFTVFIEKEFGIEIEPEAVLEGSLVSIDSSAQYIEGRLT